MCVCVCVRVRERERVSGCVIVKFISVVHNIIIVHKLVQQKQHKYGTYTHCTYIYRVYTLSGLIVHRS